MVGHPTAVGEMLLANTAANGIASFFWPSLGSPEAASLHHPRGPSTGATTPVLICPAQPQVATPSTDNGTGPLSFSNIV